MDKRNFEIIADLSDKFNKEVIKLVENGWVIKSSIHDTVLLAKGALSCQVSLETCNECTIPIKNISDEKVLNDFYKHKNSLEELLGKNRFMMVYLMCNSFRKAWTEALHRKLADRLPEKYKCL